jgi:hypothetical protein
MIQPDDSLESADAKADEDGDTEGSLHHRL